LAQWHRITLGKKIRVRIPPGVRFFEKTEQYLCGRLTAYALFVLHLEIKSLSMAYYFADEKGFAHQ
jgi:hypothetical protein